MPGVQVAVTGLVGFWCAFAAGDVTLRGRVVDKTGKPVAEAQVFCLKPLRINASIESVDGKTGADGVFAVTVSGVDKPADLKDEAVLIYAEGYGLGVTTTGELLGSAADAAPAAVALPGETEKTFRVLDPQGRPVAGALVEPVNYQYGAGAVSSYGRGLKVPETMMQAVGRTTDELGIATFSALAAEKMRTVHVVSEEYGQQEVGWPARIATIRMRATARVEILFDRARGSMGKCRVVAFTSSPDAFSAQPFGPGETPRERATTGVAHGVFDDPREFIIPAIADGRLNFRLSGCSNREAALPVWPEKTQLEAGKTTNLLVPLEETVAVRGRVVDRLTGQPCPNVVVVIKSPSDQVNTNVMMTVTDEEGRYRCNVLKGSVSVSATRGDPNDVVYGMMPPSTFQAKVDEEWELRDCLLPSERSASK